MDNTPSKLQQLRAGLIGMIGNRGVLFVASFFTSVILARWLGPAGRGEYGIYTTTVTTMVVTLNFGIASANTVIVGRKPSAYRQLIANTMVFAICISIPLFLIPQFINSDKLASLIQMPSSYWIMASINFWLTMTFLSLSGILLGQQDYKAYNGISLFQGVLNLIGAIVALIFLQSGIAGLIMINGLLITLIVVIATLWVFIRKSSRFPAAGGPSWKLFRETAPVGTRATIIAILENLHFRIDLLLLGFWIGKESVGIYALAVYIANVLMFLPPILNSMIFSHIPSNGIGSAKTIVQLSYMVMIIPVIGILAVWIAGRSLIGWIYTPQFLPAFVPLLVLLIAEIPKAQVAITAGFLAGIGYPAICIVGALVGLIVNVLLNIWLIPNAAETGAAIASVISYSIFAMIYLIGVYKYGQLTLKDLEPSIVLMKENMQRFIQPSNRIGQEQE